MTATPYLSDDSQLTAALLLASQPGEGFAHSRWLAPWGGAPLLGHVLDVVRTWPVARRVVVLGADAEEILERLDFEGFSVIIDPEWEEGEVASVRAGLDFFQHEEEIEIVVVASAAAVAAPASVVDRLLEERVRSGRPAVVPKYRYAQGRPVVVKREIWPRLLGLETGTTIEAVLATHAHWVAEVWLDSLPPRVIATPEDLAELAPRR